MTQDPLLCRRVTLVNQRGLHARAAARLVQTASQFKATITVTTDADPQGVLAHSILGLLTLGAGVGQDITLTATGAEAEMALGAVCALIAQGFGEASETP